MELKHYLLGGLLLLCGCAAQLPGVDRTRGFVAPPNGTPVYIVPFVTILTPAELGEVVFDRFVDEYNAQAVADGYEGVILKVENTAIDANWLNRQYYVTGEIFAYRQESGCCSTELRLKARLHLFQPDNPAPVANVEVPVEIFFDHDQSNLEVEKEKLVATLATRLSDALLTLSRP